MHPSAALVVEKVPNSSICSSKSPERALLLRDGLSTVLAAEAVWPCRAVTGTRCHQLWLPVGCSPSAACLPLAGSSELVVVSEVAQPGRCLPLGAQPSICCYFHAEVMGEGYYCSHSNTNFVKPLQSVSLWICFMHTVKFSATSTPCPRFRV